MAKTFQEGDRVQVIHRTATAEDEKSGLYYTHFRGLTGTIQKIYATQEVAVEIEPESLAENIAHRHHDVQESMKAKWLDGLSDEARNRLSDKEKDFRLRYTILVTLKDLTAPGPKAVSPAAPAASVASSTASSAPLRKTAADYEADEQAYLQSRQRSGNSHS